MKINSITNNNYQKSNKQQNINFKGFRVMGLANPEDEYGILLKVKKLTGDTFSSAFRSVRECLSEDCRFWSSTPHRNALDDEALDLNYLLTKEQREKLIGKGRNVYLFENDRYEIVDMVIAARGNRAGNLYDAIDMYIDTASDLPVSDIRKDFGELNEQQSSLESAKIAIKAIREKTCKALGIKKKNW